MSLQDLRSFFRYVTHELAPLVKHTDDITVYSPQFRTKLLKNINKVMKIEILALKRARVAVLNTLTPRDVFFLENEMKDFPDPLYETETEVKVTQFIRENSNLIFKTITASYGQLLDYGSPFTDELTELYDKIDDYEQGVMKNLLNVAKERFKERRPPLQRVELPPRPTPRPPLPNIRFAVARNDENRRRPRDTTTDNQRNIRNGNLDNPPNVIDVMNPENNIDEETRRQRRHLRDALHGIGFKKTGGLSTYCVKCKQMRQMKDTHPFKTSNHRQAVKGVCSVCGTKLIRFIKKNDSTSDSDEEQENLKKKTTTTKKGGSLTAADLEHLLRKSYDSELSNHNDFHVDKDLSDKRVQVYHNPHTKQTVVAHRGTKDLSDWLTNVRYALGDESDHRFQHSKNIQQAAEGKYGTQNLTTIGHSLGAKLDQS
jgi:hypothetical protein